MSDGNNNEQVISFRLNAIERVLSGLSDSMRQLVTLEQKHIETRESLGRAFSRIDEHEKRVREIEQCQTMTSIAVDRMDPIDTRVSAIEAEMPTLKLIRGWVITGVLGILSIAGMALFGLILK